MHVSEVVVVVVVIAGVIEPFVEGVVLMAAHIRPDEPANILSLCAFEVNHAPQSVCAKDDA